MTTKKTTAADRTADNLVTFNQEAFESAIGIQMNVLDTATRFAREFTSFAVHRAEANTEDFAKFAGARSPSELLRLQQEHMRTMFEDYSTEANRLIDLANDTVKEGSAAVRATCFGKDELEKAG